MIALDEAFRESGRTDFNIEIYGFSIHAEEVTSEESFNRRETNRQKIMGGTEFVSRGAYVPRTYEITTHLSVPKDRPHAYDHIFREMCSKPVAVTGPEVGGEFNAEVKVTRTRVAPMVLEVVFSITEIPGERTNIPFDTFAREGTE